jgi:cellulose synthase/poly-beta-1,6-N-acetylglucosamine synthase-like glycosyltransferase
MIWVFYFLAAILILLSVQSLRGGINYYKYFRKELAKPESEFVPFATIFSPCRGLDDGLEKNLTALFGQDYPHFEVLFVVDSIEDESVTVIQKLIAANNHPAKLIVAGKTTFQGQKVHNLRQAVLEVSDASQVFAFADSDARPSPNWLRNLAAPLANEKIGVATGYRWFISKNGGFASELRSAWNASIASALGVNIKSNFCWGGSMAIRRKTFDELQIREKWRGTLSDDFAVNRAMKDAGLAIYFVPQCLTASVEDCTFHELLEFTTRQMKITRVYSANLWLASFIGSGLFNLIYLWGLFLIIFSGVYSFAFWFALITLLSVSFLSTGKAWLRLKAVKLVLKEYENQLNQQFFPQNTLWILSPALFFYNAFRALLSRKIVWRGIVYELTSPNETKIIKQLPKPFR